MKLQELKDRSNAIEQGKWVPCQNLPGVSVKVRGLWNSDYRRLFWQRMAALPKDKRSDPAEIDKIEVECLSTAVLIGWSGIDDMEYSSENAATLLGDPETLAFRIAVDTAARAVTEIGVDDLKDLEKN